MIYLKFKSDTVQGFHEVTEGEKHDSKCTKDLLISLKGGGVSQLLLLRKRSGAIGVGTYVLFNSPIIAKIEVLKKAKVRRNKIFLYS